MSVVSVHALTHEFDGQSVLRDVTLEVADSEILAVMGSSGGGKTTLLRCISGLIKPTRGSIVVDGVDVGECPDEARSRMGMVFQSAALFDYMNVLDNVLFGIRRILRHKPDEANRIAIAALEKVGLVQEDGLKMPAELSGGMRKRVGIARAIALGPKVMLYDEPTTGLDPITTYTIDLLIHGLRREMGGSSLVVSHDVNSVLRVADRVAFLHEGHLAFVGTSSEFQESDFEPIQELIAKASASTLF